MTRRRFDTLMNRLSVRGLIAYHPLDEVDERGNRYDPGEVLAAQLDAMVAGGHLLLPNTQHPPRTTTPTRSKRRPRS